MNIQEVKAFIGAKAGICIPTLMLVGSKDEAGVVDNTWPSHWDNESRVKIVMHTEVLTKIQADPTFNGLAVKPMEVIPERPQTDPAGFRASYRKFMVITPTDVIATI